MDFHDVSIVIIILHFFLLHPKALEDKLCSYRRTYFIISQVIWENIRQTDSASALQETRCPLREHESLCTAGTGWASAGGGLCQQDRLLELQTPGDTSLALPECWWYLWPWLHDPGFVFI